MNGGLFDTARRPDPGRNQSVDHKHWIDYMARHQHGRAMLSPALLRWHEQRQAQGPQR